MFTYVCECDVRLCVCLCMRTCYTPLLVLPHPNNRRMSDLGSFARGTKINELCKQETRMMRQGK